MFLQLIYSIDDWLVDRFCQPIADWVHDRCGLGHYGLAIILFVAASVFVAIGNYQISSAGMNAWYLIIVLLMFLVLLQNQPARGPEDETTGRAMNPARMKKRTRYVRYCIILLKIGTLRYVILGLFYNPLPTLYFQVFGTMSLLSYFFAACSQKPREPKRKLVLSEA